jgi:hypothetical protein
MAFNVQPPLPPQTTEEYQNYLGNFIDDNLSQFFDPSSKFVKELAKTAAETAKKVATELGLSAHTASGLARLALYDFVILCGEPIPFYLCYYLTLCSFDPE